MEIIAEYVDKILMVISMIYLAIIWPVFVQKKIMYKSKDSKL